MKQNIVIVGALSLMLGLGAGYVIGSREPAPGAHVMPNGTQMTDTDMSMGSAMEDMNAALKGKTGDEFDKAFLEQMTVHHQGAVEMAQAALTSAKHDELKQMARDIISAQTKEIGQMKTWMTDWYEQK